MRKQAQQDWKHWSRQQAVVVIHGDPTQEAEAGRAWVQKQARLQRDLVPKKLVEENNKTHSMGCVTVLSMYNYMADPNKEAWQQRSEHQCRAGASLWDHSALRDLPSSENESQGALMNVAPLTAE